MSEPVLVTGATGFIGRALAARLRKDKREVIALGSQQGDISAAATLEPFRSRKLDCIFHLASLTYVPDSWADRDAFLRINVGGTQNVLALCRATGASLVYMSAYVYGVVSHQPIGEDVTPRPNNPYAESKVLAERACSTYSAESGLPVTVLRPFNVYGPGQDVRFLVPTIVGQVLAEKPIEVLDLRPRRDWVFVDDVAEAAVAAMHKMGGYRVYNIGSGASVSVAELVARIQELADTRLPVLSKEQPRSEEIADTVADIGRARKELGWLPQTSLDQGLRKCIEAMKKR